MAKWNRERGAAAVEFAILLPFLMILLMGIMEFGYLFVQQASVSNVARVGARNYAINWNDKAKGLTSQATAIDQARQALLALPNQGGVVEAVTLSNCAAGIQTTMTVVYKYKSLTGMFDNVLGNMALTLRGSMQCGG